MEHELASVVRRQELVHQPLVRDHHDLLRVGQERAVRADGARQEDALVLGDTPGHEGGIHRLLSCIHPPQHPAQVANGQRVVVLASEGAGVVQRAVSDHRHHRESKTAGDGQGLEGVEPADAAGPAEDAGSHRRRVLNDLELRVLALGDDVLALELPVGNQLRHKLHDRVVWPDGIGRQHIHICQRAGDGNGFSAAYQLLSL